MHADYTVQKTLCIVQVLFTRLITTLFRKNIKNRSQTGPSRLQSLLGVWLGLELWLVYNAH